MLNQQSSSLQSAVAKQFSVQHHIIVIGFIHYSIFIFNIVYRLFTPELAKYLISTFAWLAVFILSRDDWLTIDGVNNKRIKLWKSVGYSEEAEVGRPGVARTFSGWGLTRTYMSTLSRPQQQFIPMYLEDSFYNFTTVQISRVLDDFREVLPLCH